MTDNYNFLRDAYFWNSCEIDKYILESKRIYLEFIDTSGFIKLEKHMGGGGLKFLQGILSVLYSKFIFIQ